MFQGMQARLTFVAAAVFGAGVLGMLAQAPVPSQDWTNYVRIGAYGLGRDDPDQIVGCARKAMCSDRGRQRHPGRYESFLHPEEKLQVIRAMAEKAHQAGTTPSFTSPHRMHYRTRRPDPRTLAKDHPDWLQRKITGEPAIFWRRHRLLDQAGR